MVETVNLLCEIEYANSKFYRFADFVYHGIPVNWENVANCFIGLVANEAQNGELTTTVQRRNDEVIFRLRATRDIARFKNVLLHAIQIQMSTGSVFEVITMENEYQCAVRNIEVSCLDVGYTVDRKFFSIQHRSMPAQVVPKTIQKYSSVICHLLNVYHDMAYMTLTIGLMSPKMPDIELRFNYESIPKIQLDIQGMNADYVRCDLYLYYSHAPEITERTDSKFVIPRRVIHSEHSPETMNLIEMKKYKVMRLECRIKHSEFVFLLSRLTNIRIYFGRVKKNAQKVDTTSVDEPRVPFTDYDKWCVRFMVQAICSLGVYGEYFMQRYVQQARFQNLDAVEECNYLTAMYRLISTSVDPFENLNSLDDDLKIPPSLADENNSGYVQIRRVIVTPTRIILCPPEDMMGFRVCREFVDVRRLIRVSFKEESMNKLRITNEKGVEKGPVFNRVLSVMVNGLQIAGENYKYLGYSNSQFEDASCYFLQTDSAEELTEIVKRAGDFKQEGVAKMMSRFGQCFTQTKTTHTRLKKYQIGSTHDYEGWSPTTGKRMCYSDGVGVISREYSQRIAAEIHAEGSPTTFQIRFGGYKGVVAVDPLRDTINSWLNKPGQFYPALGESTDDTLRCDLLLRPSQSKFTTNNDDKSLEIVTYSKPSSMDLNKNLINVMCQVSRNQGAKCHRRIRRRIFALLDNQVDDILRTLTDADLFNRKLSKIPCIPVVNFQSYTTLIAEPFFRSIAIKNALESLDKLADKCNISLPFHLARNFLGIVDTTGLLQYGQVFFQYTENIFDDSKNPVTVIHTGPVMVTKFPVSTEGDVRRLEAVDIPALRYHNNVIVFPHSGPRPHPDEMAGSDLDGDVYAVFWDPELLFERNEDAFDYTPPKAASAEKSEIPIEKLHEESIKFFVDYIFQPSIGVVTSNFLHNSDFYGINAEVCQNLAKKQTIVLDSKKTGVFLESLTKKWKDDLPPEKREMDSQAKSGGTDRFLYRSARLMGAIVDRINTVCSEIQSNMMDSRPVEPDIHIFYPGWEAWRGQAAILYADYSKQITSCLLSFGIAEEVELFADTIRSTNHPFKIQFDKYGSEFTLTYTAGAQLKRIFVESRKAFFKACNLDPFYAVSSDEEICKTKAINLNDDAKRLAVACYYLAYGEKKRILSFPWIAWDVISDVRFRNMIHEDINLDPIATLAYPYITNSYGTQRQRQSLLQKCVQELTVFDHNRYPELLNLMAVCTRWKRLFCGKSISSQIVRAIFMEFALGNLPKPPGYRPFIQNLELASENNIEIHRWNAECGRHMIWFMRSLALNEFADLEKIDLTASKSVYGLFEERKTVIRQLHEAAKETLMKLAFQMDVETLCGVRTNANDSVLCLGMPFVVLLPPKIDISVPKLLQMSGCTHIATRLIGESCMGRERWKKVMIWSNGTQQNNTILRDLLTVMPDVFRVKTDAECNGVSCKTMKKWFLFKYAQQLYQILDR